MLLKKHIHHVSGASHPLKTEDTADFRHHFQDNLHHFNYTSHAGNNSHAGNTQHTAVPYYHNKQQRGAASNAYVSTSEQAPAFHNNNVFKNNEVGKKPECIATNGNVADIKRYLSLLL